MTDMVIPDYQVDAQEAVNMVYGIAQYAMMAEALKSGIDPATGKMVGNYDEDGDRYVLGVEPVFIDNDRERVVYAVTIMFESLNKPDRQGWMGLVVPFAEDSDALVSRLYNYEGERIYTKEGSLPPSDESTGPYL